MEVIYVDVLAAVNLVVDFVLLALTARLAGVFVRPMRLFAGAALGAMYAVVSVCPVPWFLLWVPTKLAVGYLMVWATFATRTALVRVYILFLAVACGFAGFTAALTFVTGTTLGNAGVYYIAVPLRVVLGACVLAYLLAGLFFRGSAKHGVVHATTVAVTLACFGKSERFSLLLDSGCDLTDPTSGCPVLIVDRQAVARLFPAQLRFVLPALANDNAAQVFARIPAPYQTMFRLLPFSAVGTQGGLLLMFRPTTAVRGDGKALDTYVAISPQRIANGRYEGLIGL